MIASIDAPAPAAGEPVLRSTQGICRWELDVAMPAERAREIAVGFGAALLARLGKSVDAVVVEDRLAVLALPRLPISTSGSELAAVGMLVPRRPSRASARALREAVLSLGRDGFSVGARELRLRRARSAGYEAHRWVGPSCVWTSVTPWVPETGRLERLATRRQAQLLDSLALALATAREAEPSPSALEELVIEAQSHEEAWLPGLSSAGEFAEGRSVGRSHVRISFSRPVEGPIAIGRERLRGMGLLAPIEMPREPWGRAEPVAALDD